MHRSLPLLLLAAFLSGTAAAGDTHVPLVPLTSTLSHWDHHWFVWLPRHPVYESVEIASRDTPDHPLQLVWVFFTERDGVKRQVHYLNNRDVMTHVPGSLYREIHCERSGTAGRPQSVTVRLHDQNNQLVDIDITADDHPLSPAGLTNQSGHAATRHFLVFFREQQALAVRNRVVIAGEDFSFTTDDRSTTQYRFKAGYSANVYVVTLPFTTTRFRSEAEHLTSTGGHLFTKMRSAEEEVVSTSPAGGSPEVVQLALTTQGGLKTYTHQSDGHRFTIRFTPPLVWGAVEQPEPVTYSMSLDRFPDLVQGQVQSHREGQRLVLEWRHTSPQWAQAYAFQSVITFEEDGGYQLVVSPLR